MPMWLRKELRRIAMERDVSMGHLVRETMEQFVRESRQASGTYVPERRSSHEHAGPRRRV
jgi:hypothetical protein